MKRYFIAFALCFSICFLFKTSVFAGSKTLSYTVYGSFENVSYNFTFSSDYDLRICGGRQYDNGLPIRFYISSNYGDVDTITYDLVMRTTRVDTGVSGTETFSGSVTNRSSVNYDGGVKYYYELEGFSFYPSSGYVEQSLETLNRPNFLLGSSAFNDYLFNPQSVFPDFSDYEYSYQSLVLIGYPFGYQLDAGVSWWSLLKYYYFGEIFQYSDNVIIQFIGSEDEIFFYPSLSPSGHGFEFDDTRSIGSLVRPNSKFFVVATPINTVNKTYGDTLILEYEIGESFIGKLIRSFGSSSGYYTSTLNVNGTNQNVVNIVSVDTYTSKDRPSQYGYDYYFNNVNKYDRNTYYYPTFENSTNFTDGDINYIEDNYYDNDITNITENVITDFDFNFGDISTNDIQKMYDETTDLIGVIGNLFSLVASLFTICFPFLMFDIPGWLLFIGGLFLVAAGVGLFIKIVSFFRG